MDSGYFDQITPNKFLAHCSKKTSIQVLLYDKHCFHCLLEQYLGGCFDSHKKVRSIVVVFSNGQYYTCRSILFQHGWVSFCFVLSQGISSSESFITGPAGKNGSFKVVCFNVVFYCISCAFLSTYLANICLFSFVR